MKYLSIINGFDIEINETNNNKKDTLLFIHGLFSSGGFINNMEQLNNNFNIITFTFPGKTKDKIRLNQYIDVTQKIIKRIKHSKVHLVAHSMGAAVAASVASMHKVKSIVLVAPVNPFMVKSKLYTKLETVLNPKTTKEKMISSLVKGGSWTVDAFANSGLSNFISSKNIWSDVVKYDLLNKTLIVDELNQNYSDNIKKFSFIGADEDILIKPKDLNDYVKTLNKSLTIIKNSGHNPFKDTSDVHKYLNIKYKSREKIFKIKHIYKDK